MKQNGSTEAGRVSPRRVLHLSSSASGGSYRYAASLSRELERLGVDSRVMTASGGEPLAARMARKALARVLRGARRTEDVYIPGWLPLAQAPRFEGEDILHIHNAIHWLDLGALLPRLPRSVTVVLTLHDVWPLTGGCIIYRGCRAFTDGCGHCPIFRSAARPYVHREWRRKVEAQRGRLGAVVTNSQWLLDVVKESPVVTDAKVVAAIAPPIDVDAFSPGDGILMRRELGIADDAFVVLAGAADLRDANKNIGAALRICRELATRRKVAVILVGAGEVPVAPGDATSLKIARAGLVADDGRLAALFRSANAFLSTSLMETFGMMAAEAMACGLPVVAFRVGGLGDLWSDAAAVRFVDAAAESDAAAALDAIAGDVSVARSMATAARAAAVARFAPAQVAHRYLDVYARAATRGASA